ncbi:MAG TPA: hypothetical protein DEO60_13000 [Bacteroidales bacterium]|nr:hypothetical protein [Bacteroidales bacterium]HBZ22042.1 hypothetical protein [Bacteroidales bacterium]
MKNIYLEIPVLTSEISDMVLATVISTEGSTPQKPGSSALFNKSGLIAGTIGGGVLEGKVQNLAMGSIEKKEPVYRTFTLDTNASAGEDALCGGRITILIDPDLVRHRNIFEELRKSSGARVPGVLITHVSDEGNEKILVRRYWAADGDTSSVPHELEPLIELGIKGLTKGVDSYDLRKLEIHQKEGKTSQILILEPVIPPPRLIIAGAGHVGKAVAQIGGMLGFEVTVIDDRCEFANSDNIPSANHFICGDIGESIEKAVKGEDAYFVIVTRGHRDDGKALKACIGSDAAYIGMIGSKTKIALMRREFIEKGWATEDQWEKVFAPIGLDIRSVTVEEIAVSIAAQLVQVKNA